MIPPLSVLYLHCAINNLRLNIPFFTTNDMFPHMIHYVCKVAGTMSFYKCCTTNFRSLFALYHKVGTINTYQLKVHFFGMNFSVHFFGDKFWGPFLGMNFGSIFGDEFWVRFWGRILGSVFGDEFWGPFLGRILGSVFWVPFLGTNFGVCFLGSIFGDEFWGLFLGTNFGVCLLKVPHHLMVTRIRFNVNIPLRSTLGAILRFFEHYAKTLR